MRYPISPLYTNLGGTPIPIEARTPMVDPVSAMAADMGEHIKMPRKHTMPALGERCGEGEVKRVWD